MAVGYFAFYSRHRLVAAAPEEEFAALAAAEAELERGTEDDEPTAPSART